jgi:CheY-like chemotaxis protein
MSDKRILILEDDHQRHSKFKSALIGNYVIIVETVEECVGLLSSESWDALFLDHDLGGDQMVASGPGTGYEVACWLEERPHKRPPIIIIHSLNNQGAPKMQAALPGSVLAPGAWMAEDLPRFWEILSKKGS